MLVVLLLRGAVDLGGTVGYLARMLDEKARAQFRRWGSEGGKTRAKRYTKRQLSLMARNAFKRKKVNGAKA